MHNCFVYKVSYLCFGGLETSSSLRQASSSCARVLGGGRGGIAGSWMKGWPGWWPRRWAPLPMPPPPQDEEVRPGRVLGSSGLDFFRPWVLLKQKKGQPLELRTQCTFLKIISCKQTLTCVACAFPASHSLGSTAKHSESGRWQLEEGVVKTRPHRRPSLAVWTKCCSDWRKKAN